MILTVLLLTLISLCAFCIVYDIYGTKSPLNYPSLFSAVVVFWIVPQLYGTSLEAGLPEFAVERLTFFAILCQVGVLLGYYRGFKFTGKLTGSGKIDYRIAEKFGVVLSLLGSYFFFKVEALAADATREFGGAWTGVVTIYVFLSGLLTVGLAISLICYFKQRTWLSLLFSVLDSSLYLKRIFVDGRRALAVELVLMVLICFLIFRGRVLSRKAFIIMLIPAALLVHSTGDYRSVMLGDDRASWSGAGLSQIFEIDYFDNLLNLTKGGVSESEVRNAEYYIDGIDNTFNFDFGLSLWNALVLQYVPAQILGAGFKSAIMFPFADAALSVHGYSATGGTTLTGFVDAFASFWYFGWVKFYIISFFVARWTARALRGDYFSQILLLTTASPSLHALTHDTHHFFIGWINCIIFGYVSVYFCRINPIRRG